MPQSAVDASLTLARGAGGQVGAARIALLEAIGAHGSIAAAARVVGLSYKGAWDAVQALNNLFPRPLVLSRPGGRAGGAASVTADGEAVIAVFRRAQDDLSRAMAAFEGRFADRATPPVEPILGRLSMKTSARNALRGTVTSVTDGAVNAEVVLDLGGGAALVAIITQASVADLGLAPGREAIALIKSSFIILAPGDQPLRTSARNALRGTISRREDGAVNSEISLDIGSGKTVTAIVTRQSAEALDLEVGDPAVALVKASHIILAVE